MLRRSVPLLVVAAALAGCAGTPQPDPRIADLRQKIDQARGDSTIARYAPAQLQEAQHSLAQADADSHQGESTAVDHDLYMGQRQLDVAHAVASTQAARDQRQALAQEGQMRAAQDRTNQLEQELHARQTPQGTVLTLTDVLFETGKATLRPGALNRMQPLASYLRDHPDATATIQGFTDSKGSPAINQELSQARADAVRDFLVGEGIDPGRVMARGMGEDYPIASNSTQAGRQQNRRVEVLLSEAAPPPVR